MPSQLSIAGMFESLINKIRTACTSVKRMICAVGLANYLYAHPTQRQTYRVACILREEALKGAIVELAVLDFSDFLYQRRDDRTFRVSRS